MFRLGGTAEQKSLSCCTHDTRTRRHCMPSGGTLGTFEARQSRRGSRTMSRDTFHRTRDRNPTVSGGNSRLHRNRLNNPLRFFLCLFRRLGRGRRRPGRSTTPLATCGGHSRRARFLRRCQAPQTSGQCRTGTRPPTRKTRRRECNFLRRPSTRATRCSIPGRAGAFWSHSGRAQSRGFSTVHKAASRSVRD